ncbi:GTPase IMAP family member 8 [Genypterus blacodes]|uniref:GTPase IMAP family member 8 n=1 Tax=Genypterus blacodes TaxID=154954 RepID=UPI003F7644E6
MAGREVSAHDCTSHLKVVLLGGRNSGKSCVGNLILGKEEFVTRERTASSRRLGEVSGRWVTVVDTPGWWCDFNARDTCELVKREIVSGVSLCSPGPHVFLIVVKVRSFSSEKRRRALEEHVGLLGERVWSHCIVVFTYDTSKQARAAEDAQKTCGTARRWLSEKCSQRCHGVALRTDGSHDEVTQLLVKIQKLVTENGNRTFAMPANILEANAEKKRTVEERARRRFMRMKTHRALMQETLHHLSEIRIVMVGARGCGKSSAVNTILGREGSQQCRRTARCIVGQGCVFGRQVTIVDTPGWWMNYFSAESPIFDQRQIRFSASLCPPGPHVFLLAIRADRAFSETYRRAIQEHLQLIDEHIWSQVIVLFNFGDWLGCTTTEQYIESEGEPLRRLVEQCGNRYHVLNNKTKGDGFQVRELIGKIEETAGGWYYETEGNMMKQLREKMRREEERAKERLRRKEKQRQMAQSQLESLKPLPELRIVLVGGSSTGKSSSGNTILSSARFSTESQTTSCAEKQTETNGKMVTVLDTPGCLSLSSDLLMSHATRGLTAVLLVVNLSSSFTRAHREAAEDQLEAVRGHVWSRAMVLFSHGDWLGDTDVEQRIESEGEPLQRLVERCGNRYHTLDNRHWGDGAQVRTLLGLIEEMLIEERLRVFERGDDIGKRISLPQNLQQNGVTLYNKDTKAEFRVQLCHDLRESSLSLNCPEGPDARGQTLELPGRSGGRLTLLDRHTSRTNAVSVMFGDRLKWPLVGPQRITVKLPVWLSSGQPQSPVRLNGERQLCPLLPTDSTVVLVFPQTQHRMLAEDSEDVTEVHSLHPSLRERTLRRITESGGLQALIDRWGDSNLEELENFIDSYSELVWEQAMTSSQPGDSDCLTPEVSEQDAVTGDAGLEVLSSINRKLSKLDLLEEIQRDVAELRQSMEHSWRAIKELRDTSKPE